MGSGAAGLHMGSGDAGGAPAAYVGTASPERAIYKFSSCMQQPASSSQLDGSWTARLRLWQRPFVVSGLYDSLSTSPNYSQRLLIF